MAGVFEAEGRQLAIEHGLDARPGIVGAFCAALGRSAADRQVAGADAGVRFALAGLVAVQGGELPPGLIDHHDHAGVVEHGDLVGHRVEHVLDEDLAFPQGILGLLALGGVDEEVEGGGLLVPADAGGAHVEPAGALVAGANLHRMAGFEAAAGVVRIEPERAGFVHGDDEVGERSCQQFLLGVAELGRQGRVAEADKAVLGHADPFGARLDEQSVALFAVAQTAFGLALLDGDAGQAGHLFDQGDVGGAGGARFAMVDRQGAEYAMGRGADRLRPAGSQARSRRQMPVGRPVGVGGDVLDDDAFAGERGRAAGADADADLQALDGGVVEIGQAGRDAVAEPLAVAVELLHAAQHGRVQLLDAGDHRGQDVRQRGAAGQHFEDVAAEALVVLDLLALADVGDHADHTGIVGARPVEGAAGQMAPKLAAVGSQVEPVEVHRWDFVGEQRVHPLACRLTLGGQHEVGVVAADQPVHRQLEHLRHAPVGQRDAPVLVDQENRHEGGVEDLLQQGLAVGQVVVGDGQGLGPLGNAGFEQAFGLGGGFQRAGFFGEQAPVGLADLLQQGAAGEQGEDDEQAVAQQQLCRRGLNDAEQRQDAAQQADQVEQQRGAEHVVGTAVRRGGAS